MQEIPPVAMQGLSRNQMAHIMGLTCAVFSTAQSANLNPSSCGGFEPECIRSLSSQALSAFTAKCVAKFPIHMIEMLSPSQFTAIQPPSLRGLSCDQVQSMQKSTVQVITPDMLSNLSRACCFLNSDRLPSLQDDTLKTITSSCMEEAGDSIFQNIGVRRFYLIPKRAYSGIRYDQAILMEKRVVDAFSLEDLLQTLSGSAMMGLLSDTSRCEELMIKWGMSLVRNLTVAHVYPESSYEVRSMKNSLFNANLDPNVFVVHWNEISHRLASTNWLEVYFLSPDTDMSVFTDSVVKLMMESNFFGLKVDFFKKMPPHVFKYATREDVSLWTFDFKEAVTADMFREFNLDAFLQLYPNFWYIPTDLISIIPTAVIPHLDFYSLYCDDVSHFTTEQKAVMTPEQTHRLNYLAVCLKFIMTRFLNKEK